jgi:hypothetical protein
MFCAGDDSCQGYANDGECDAWNGRCTADTDVSDCGRKSTAPTCPYATVLRILSTVVATDELLTRFGRSC